MIFVDDRRTRSLVGGLSESCQDNVKIGPRDPSHENDQERAGTAEHAGPDTPWAPKPAVTVVDIRPTGSRIVNESFPVGGFRAPSCNSRWPEAAGLPSPVISSRTREWGRAYGVPDVATAWTCNRVEQVHGQGARRGQ